MTGKENRTLWVGVFALSAAMLLLELLNFRLCAAALGFGVAMLVGVLGPAAAGLGAMVLAARTRSVGPAELARAAAHHAALGGATTLLGAIGLTWVSTAMVSAKASALHTSIALAASIVPAFCNGAALALALRAGAGAIGRVGFVEALGGVVGCLSIPIILLLGAPRALLVCAMLHALAAVCWGYLGRSAQPKWAMILTLPLAVVSLMAGDYGDPWLSVRPPLGKRTKIDFEAWTAQGLIAVTDVSRSGAKVAVDQRSGIPLGKREAAGKKPRFALQDLPYALQDGKVQRGAVLVIGSAAGREIAVALAHEHPRVDAIELHAALVNEVMLARYGELTGNLLDDSGRVHVRIGDGRGGVDALPAGDYEHVVVMGHARFDQATPRLLPRHDRLFTVEAIAAYLRRLRPGGSVLLQVNTEVLPSAVVAARAAVGEGADERVLACRGEGKGFVVAYQGKLSASVRENATKRCKKSSGVVEFPLEEVRRGRRDYDKLLAERAERLAAFDAARAALDDRPFLGAQPPPAALHGAALHALRALGMAPQPTTSEGDEAAGSGDTTAGVAASALVAAIAFLLVGFAVPIRRARPSDARAPLSLLCAFPLLGAALALCLFALGDAVLRAGGNAEHAWLLIVPLGVAGAGSGRLWADAIPADAAAAQRRLFLALGLALAWLAAMAAAHRLIPALASGGAQLAVTLGSLTLTGALLGHPLAAGLRRLASRDAAAIPWAWGAHAVGWAAGGALATLLVHYLGVQRLWLVGIGVFAAGAALLAMGARPAPPRPASATTRSDSASEERARVEQA